MASVYYLVPSVDEFLEKLQQFSHEHEDNGRILFNAARTIQSFVRRFLIQRYIKKLNTSAIVIQIWYRGWRGRVFYRILLKETVEEMYWNHYNRMARKIQKTWLGYLSRRNVFSYYALKKWISKVQNKNVEVLAEIKANEIAIRKQKMMEFEEEARKWVVFILSKLHHLLSTKVVAGVYSKQYSVELSDFETLLKRVKYKTFMIHLRQYYKKVVLVEKPSEKSGKIMPVIGHSDLYWYLSEEEIETMIGIGRELRAHEIQKNYIVKHPKPFNILAHLTCKERKKKWHVPSVFDGKYEPKRDLLSRQDRHELDISKTKFNNIINPNDISESTLNYIEYHINVLLRKKCACQGGMNK